MLGVCGGIDRPDHRQRRGRRAVDPGHLHREVPVAGRRDRGTGAKLDFPCADFWYIKNGKIKDFNCCTINDVMLRQIGVDPDYASAVAASAVAAS